MLFDLKTFDLKAFDLKAFDVKTFDLKAFDVKTFALKAFDLKTFDLKDFDFNISFLKFSLPVTVRLNLVSFVKNDESSFLNLFKILFLTC
jgi:hypothetical protein